MHFASLINISVITTVQCNERLMQPEKKQIRTTPGNEKNQKKRKNQFDDKCERNMRNTNTETSSR